MMVALLGIFTGILRSVVSKAVVLILSFYCFFMILFCQNTCDLLSSGALHCFLFGCFFNIIMSPTKDEGGILVPVRIPGVTRGDSLYPPYFLKQWVEFCHTCMETSLSQVK